MPRPQVRTITRRLRAAAVPAFVTLLAASAASAADLPKSTQGFLKELKFGEDKLAGLDKELDVPQAWIDAAKKAPVVKVGGAEEPPQHAQMIKPFLERYPFIKVEYSRGSANERVIRPLLAYREGRYIMDVVRSMDGSMSEFLSANAAADLTDLPTYGSTVENAHEKGGIAVAFRARPYCMSYNPKLVKREDLPKTWADLPNSKVLANGRIGAVMLPHLWFMPLWGKYGEEWAVKYIDDYFTKLKPQIRREGINAAISLVGAGENYVSMPAYPERVKEVEDKGADVSWFCPDMVPLEMPKLAIFKGSPGFYAAKLYVNWLLSKEGQIAQLAVFNTLPVHKDLQTKDFYLYPQEMEGKEFISYNNQPDTEKFLQIWNKYATGTAGK